jgi:hypothetical protein
LGDASPLIEARKEIMDGDQKTVEVTPDGGQVQTAEEQPAQVPSAQTTTEAADQLPDATSERTRNEFEKLKAHNRDLAEKLKTYEFAKEYGGNVFDSVYGQSRQQPTIPSVPQAPRVEGMPNLVDENGYVDPSVLQRSLSEANARAQRAEQSAEQTRQSLRQQEESRQVREAHDKFPWLNPANKDQFDPVGFELTRDRLLRGMWDGRNQTLAEAAEEIARFRTPTVKPEELKEQAVAEYKEKQTARAQASSVQSGKGQPREEQTRVEDLRRRTQMGDQDALDERLRNL